MATTIEKRYFDIIKSIGGQVQRIHQEGTRKDLVFVYKMKEDLLNSYVYLDFLKMLNEQSQGILKAQFAEAIMHNKVVFFIEDVERNVLKSFAV